MNKTWAECTSSNMNAKFRRIREVAREWSNSQDRDINGRITELENEQIKLDAGETISLSRTQLQEDLEKLYSMKAIMLCQKSRVNWQLNGEKNISFFHKAIARRRSSNTTNRIIRDDTIVTNPQEIKKIFYGFFKDLLVSTTTEKVFSLPKGLFDVIPPSYKWSMVRDFSMEEVKAALDNTDSTKAPGPDRMNAGVLKGVWPKIKNDIMIFFKEFHEQNRILKGYNSSFIDLIPKTKDPKSPADFRPISLMNAIMKLLTKVLARRLIKIMPSLVS